MRDIAHIPVRTMATKSPYGSAISWRAWSIELSGRVWRTFQGVVVLLVVTTIGVLLALTIVGRAIDRHQADKETRLVELRLSVARQVMISDLTAATIWDEAVSKLSGTPDRAWADRQLGPFFADQSGHVATVAFDGAGRMLSVNVAGDPVTPEDGAAFVQAAAPLVAELRDETRLRDRSTLAREAVRSRSGVVAVNGRAYLLGVTSVVRHTDQGSVPATDPMVASFKPFETLVGRLGSELGLTDPRFRTGTGLPRPDGHNAGLSIQDPAGRDIGRVTWIPERPGAEILAGAIPLLVALKLAMIMAGIWLFKSIAAEVQRLAESETALAAAVDRAEEGSAAKSRFLANVSHELRTPLNGVLGMAEIIESDLLTPRQRDRMAILKASGKKQLRLIENLLFVTRLQSGAVTLMPAPYSPASVLETLAKEWRPVAEAKGLTLNIMPNAAVHAFGDERQIERLLDVLIDNAIGMTQQGSVTVSARKVKRELVLEVTDAGPGVDEATAAYVAELGSGERPPVDGAGLGLPIALTLVSMMGGRALMENLPGGGVRFVVRLPQRTAEG